MAFEKKCNAGKSFKRSLELCPKFTSMLFTIAMMKKSKKKHCYVCYDANMPEFWAFINNQYSIS